MRNEPDLDQILDSALAAYTNQEPHVGMEARVLRAARRRQAVGRGWQFRRWRQQPSRCFLPCSRLRSPAPR